jgi:hypothetical protein
MLAPPKSARSTRTHVLLLELSSGVGLGPQVGAGVYQFWITPADLEARRFGRSNSPQTRTDLAIVSPADH